MDPKQRGRLLTATFQRMNRMGITEAEDIIAALAEEIERYREKITGLEKSGSSKATPVINFEDIPETLLNRMDSMDVSFDGSVSMYFNHGESDIEIIHANGQPCKINRDGKAYELCSEDGALSPPLPHE